jgi:hypothetical protein
MSTGTVTVPRAHAAANADARGAGFGALLRSEWTKFRTVRGWVIGMFIATLLTVFVGLFAAGNGSQNCQNSPTGPVLTGKACLPSIPYGPGGQVVTDSFNFAHQPLTGNGSITVRVLSLTGAHPDFSANGGVPVSADGSGPTLTPGLMPWSKAGIIIKQGTKQGSAYAAMMVTGTNGVRMQYNYTGDIAGLPGSVSAAHPRWLRLTRVGDTITGYDSADGTTWTNVGTAQLTGLPATVQVGMFATSPAYIQTSTSFGGSHNSGAPSQATGVFGDVTVSGTPVSGRWAAAAVGGGGPMTGPAGQAGPGAGSGVAGYTHAGATFTLTGSGDIAPAVPGVASSFPTATIEQSLAGAFIGLIAIVVVAAMFFTAEYRRGLIRTTLAATPRRGQVLAAKATVAAAAAFVVGLVASVVAIAVGVPLERNNGTVVLPVSALAEVRVVVGTAALLAVAAAFAVGLGAILRRSAAAITIAVAAVVLPFLLSALNILPSGPAAWLLRITPAAGLAIQQSVPQYHQVTSLYSPAGGYYPLPPFAGFAVLCCWAAAALTLAYVLLLRRDA